MLAKQASDRLLTAALAEYGDAALHKALRYATLDSPPGALPVLQALAAHVVLVDTSTARLQAAIDHLNGRLPRTDIAHWPPLAHMASIEVV